MDDVSFPSPTRVPTKKIRLPQSVPPVLPEKVLISPVPTKLSSESPTPGDQATESSELGESPKTAEPSPTGRPASPVPSPISSPSTPGKRKPSRAETVETELEMHGFMLKDKIFTERDGQVFARFIKAVNICGQLVYIELDTDGYVGIHAQDFHLVESSNVQPSKHKLQVYDQIMKDEILNRTICGIVFESQTGISSYLRHGSGMTETSFIYPNVDQTMIPIASVAFPCIRMSEIRKPTELEITHRNISETAIRLRAINISQSQNALSILLTSVDAFRFQYISFLKRQEDIFNKLSSTTKELEDYYQQYEQVTSKDERKFSQLLFNLRKRYQLSSELFTLCQNISNFASLVQDETRELVDLNRYLDKEFRGVHTIMTE